MLGKTLQYVKFNLFNWMPVKEWRKSQYELFSLAHSSQRSSSHMDRHTSIDWQIDSFTSSTPCKRWQHSFSQFHTTHNFLYTCLNRFRAFENKQPFLSLQVAQVKPSPSSIRMFPSWSQVESVYASAKIDGFNNLASIPEWFSHHNMAFSQPPLLIFWKFITYPLSKTHPLMH